LNQWIHGSSFHFPAANWTPDVVPNGPNDIATLGLSNTTNVSLSGPGGTEVNSIIFSPAATNPYTITANQRLLLISGVGIVNNSGTIQSFVTVGPGPGGGQSGELRFPSGASVGTSTTFTNNGGDTRFGDSSAGDSTFTNNGVATGLGGGETDLSNSTAANGTFINNGALVTGGSGRTNLDNNSTAANGTFINNGGLVSGAQGGQTNIGSFSAGNTAGNGTFINNGGLVSGAEGGQTQIGFSSTAGNGTFINMGASVAGAGGGTTLVSETAANGIFTSNGSSIAGAAGGKTEFLRRFSTAGSATLIANGGTAGGEGGQIIFEGLSSGGTSRIELFGNGTLDISTHLQPRIGVTVGSIEGDGIVFLGAANLGVGSNNLNTSFSGVIQDGGFGGSLTKVGSGTLILSGSNTYTGPTNANGGVLQVDSSINSNASAHGRGTLAGTGTINGNVTNNGRVSPGALGAPGVLTIAQNYTQAQYAALMIQIAGSTTGQFSVLNVLGTANLSGRLDPVLLNGFVPTIDDSFTFLNAGAVTGTLFIFNRNIGNEPEHWNVSYFPTYAILTVAPGNVAIPDQGSTFLLLALGLLGLVTYRRQLLRGQT
jgi:autotransporter-associated beta strand protein